MFVAAIAAGVLAGVPASPAPVVTGDVRSVARHTVRLNPAQMFKLAESAESNADADTALAIYAALEQNPDADIRAEARYRHAKQLLAQSRNRDAAVLLRRLLDEKPEAVVPRLELAHALQLLGDPDAALRELRAAEASGLPPAVARIVDRYSQALRASRPMGASLEIALAPDSNINRATSSNTLGTIFGDFDIDEQSKAKSGMGLSLNGQVYRRLPLGGGTNFVVRLTGVGNIYRKMEFNDIAADLGAGPEFRIGRNQLNLEVGATQRWYGQKPFTRLVRVGALWTRPIGSQMQLRLTGTAALVDNKVNDLEDGKSYGGRLELERALSSTTGIGLNMSLDREALKDPGYSTTGWRAGLIGWRDVGRMTFTAEAQFGKLQADERLALFPDKRSERYTLFSFGSTFRQLTFRGFAPIARFSIERNKSSIAFYDYKRRRSEIGVVRAF